MAHRGSLHFVLKRTETHPSVPLCRGQVLAAQPLSTHDGASHLERAWEDDLKHLLGGGLSLSYLPADGS